MRKWLKHMGFTNQQGADALGVCYRRITMCKEDGKRMSLLMRLAMSAVVHGLKPWK